MNKYNLFYTSPTWLEFLEYYDTVPIQLDS